MKELADILKAYRENEKQPMALATVVKTEGSSYRRMGARMLIFANDRTIGSISGGCLEQDVVAHAKKVMRCQKNVVVTYDTTAEEDILFGVGLGCRGVVEVLVENFAARPAGDAADLPGFLNTLVKEHRTGVLATVIRLEGETTLQLGDRLMVNDDGSCQGSVPQDLFENRLLGDAQEALRTGRSAVAQYVATGGMVDFFIEVVHPPTRLVIFGAGYDAVPMVRLAKEMGLHVTVVDRRPAYVSEARFPEADSVILSAGEDLPDTLNLNERTAVVVMSHHYLTDQKWLKMLLPQQLRYLGLMGPRKRAEKMLKEICDEGFIPTDEQLTKVYNPVGLDIGAETPEQIALAILGEIQTVIAGHGAGLLRDKKGSIHSPYEMSAPREIVPTQEMVPLQEMICVVSAS